MFKYFGGEKMSAKNEAQIKAIREGLEGIVQQLKDIEATWAQMPTEAKAEFELDPKTLDDLPWRSYDKGPGSWIFGDTKGAEKLVELIKESANKEVPIGDFKYKISHGRDKDFLSRTPIEKRQASL